MGIYIYIYIYNGYIYIYIYIYIMGIFKEYIILNVQGIS